ncbi:MAG: ubiE [Rickettsiales bacterium]|jgi:ubiquinone/menaquinone biosynthesis methyltransferase|nr:ubiE [Rickettsiales bacterium]
MSHPQEDNHVPFGFTSVSPQEKTRKVKDVFSRVARKYDIMNDLMSGGLHHFWKDTLIRTLAPAPGSKLLDVAGGTGDIAFRFIKATGGAATGTEVTVCDLNSSMLGEGRNRAIDKGLASGLEWVCGNAESLPVPDSTYDYYTIAFGIRNVTRIEEALREAYRVLKPGGRFLCLEFSHVNNPLLSTIYDAYSFQIIPRVGQLVAGDRDSYQYLVESIRTFPTQANFKKMLDDAGFSQTSYRNLSGGIVAIHSGWRI